VPCMPTGAVASIAVSFRFPSLRLKRSIRIDAQPMSGREMALQHLAAPPHSRQTT
jgi:hypothetical protein